MVSIALWSFGHWRKPALELVHVSNNRAVLKNNRFRPLIIGGAWELGQGSVFYRPDGFRGGEGGFYIAGLGEFLVGTERFKPGQTANVAFKYVWPTRSGLKRNRLEEKNVVDAGDVAVAPEKHPEWKNVRITLKGAV